MVFVPTDHFILLRLSQTNDDKNDMMDAAIIRKGRYPLLGDVAPLELFENLAKYILARKGRHPINKAVSHVSKHNFEEWK